MCGFGFFLVCQTEDDAAGDKGQLDSGDAHARCCQAVEAGCLWRQGNCADEHRAKHNLYFTYHIIESKVLCRFVYRNDPGEEGAAQRLNASLDKTDNDGQRIEIALVLHAGPPDRY